MKEIEYAEELIEQYMYRCYECDTFNRAINCAIIDVENTIEALTELTSGHYTDELLTNSITYYQTVLQILKDKL